MLKRIISSILVIILALQLTLCGYSVSAAPSADGDITIATVEGVAGDSVIVPITIENNRGIMAITISITYDSSVLEYVEYYKGDILKDYMVVAHPDRNVIRFVCCETRDRTNDGTLLSLKFNISKAAKAKLHKIDISYSKGDFCNWDLEKLMPSVTAGGIEVAFTGDNCPHENYSEWTVAAMPSCKEKGADQRVCKMCGHTELRETEPIGHEYSDIWTVDEPATAEKDGTMVRYCIRCTDFVDKITYSLEQVEDGKIENEIEAEIPNNSFIEDIFKEQNPGQSLTPNKPEADSSDKPDNNSTDSTNPSDEGNDNILGDTDLDQSVNSITDIFPAAEKLFKAFKIALIVLIIIII